MPSSTNWADVKVQMGKIKVFRGPSSATLFAPLGVLGGNPFATKDSKRAKNAI
jgi:hypothetical protein